MSQPDHAFPLSYAQQRLWFLDQLSPGQSFYNIPMVMPIDTALDPLLLERCLGELLHRHESLRTRFELVDGQPRQRVSPELRPELPLIDLQALPAAQREARASELATEEARRPFDLRQGPLLRSVLLRLDTQRHLLLLTLHHIVSDAWSIGVLWSELTRLYTAFAAGRPSPLPPLPIQYADFAIWQREWLSGELRERQIAYWRARLHELPALALATDRPRPAVQSYRGDFLRVQFDAALTRGLRRLSQAAGVTLFMTVLAGFKALLQRYTAQSDIVVGAPIAGRDRAELEGLIGFFVNTLVLRTDLGEDPSVLQLLARVRETALGAYAHADLPFEMLVEELQPQRDLSRNPLFQVTFQLFASSSGEAGATPAPPLDVKRSTAPFDLSLSLWESADGLLGGIEYSTDLFDADTVSRLLGHLRVLLAGMVADPQARLSQLPLLTPQERQQLLVDWNGPRIEHPVCCLHELVQQQATRTPGAIAVEFLDQRLTYLELDQQSNQLAHALRAQGIGPDSLVGLCVQRSPAMVVALLGILKAGGAYLPLDPHYPAERLRFMLGDARVRLLLTQHELLPRLPSVEHVLCLDRDWPLVSTQPTCPPPPNGLTPGHLAYVIYTSGSTGTPKGVMISHHGLGNVAMEAQRLFGITASDRVLQFASLSFDASLFELIMALSAGATLCLSDRDTPQSDGDLLRFLHANAISIALLPPSLLAAHEAEDLPALRVLMVAGEACPPGLPARWTREGRRILNLYGPTEYTIWATCADCTGAVDRPSIGRPIANTNAYVLDSETRLVPCGVPGELYIGGIGVGRGYLGRDELSAGRFLQHPFSDTRGDRVYKTGDWVRWRPDGQLEFLGRLDHQVKLRGFRIDLGEIESVLLRHPCVRQAAVLLRDDLNAPRLVGYVQAHPGLSISPVELRRFMREHLPEHMVPHSWGILDDWPVTANGKLDREALPGTGADTEASYVAPRTPNEAALAELWADVLGLDRVGVFDNFFELGGDSILSIQVMARANQRGLGLSAKDIFKHQTIAELAGVAGSNRAPVADQGPVQGAVPLIPIQRWFFERGLPGPHHFNQAVLFKVQAGLDPGLLGRALQQLLQHHDALRLRFDGSGGDAWLPQVDEASADELLQCHALAQVAPELQADEVERLAARVQESLDPASGRLLRAALFDAGPQAPGRLLIVVHHLAVDGISWPILLEDLATAYRQLARGETVRLPPKTSSFQAWSLRLAAHARSGALDAEKAYWLAVAREPVPPLPVDRSGGDNRVADAIDLVTSLSAADTHRLLHDMPRRHHTEVNDVLLCALAQSFSAWTGRDELLIHLEGHGREPLFEDIDVSRTVGWFTSLFPVRLELPSAAPPAQALDAVKAQLRGVPNRGIGYGLLRYLGDDEALREGLRRQPHPEVAFNYFGQVSRETSTDWEPDEPRRSGPAACPQGRREHLIEVNAKVLAGRLEVTWTYGRQVHDAHTISALTARFSAAMAALLSADPLLARPSDFPQARVSQQDLDALLGRIGKATRKE